MKAAARRAVDAAMAAAMLVLMARGAYSDRLHEILGVAAFALLLCHHFLNGDWHRAYLGKPRLNGASIVDCLLFLAMIGTAVSSVLVSKEAFAFAGIEGGLLARRLHACMTAWFFFLASAHAGLHWDLAGGAASLKGGEWRLGLRRIAAWGFAAYGLYAFAAHGLPARLAMYYAYSFWPAERKLLLFIDMAAVMCLFACSTRLVAIAGHRAMEYRHGYSSNNSRGASK